MNCKVDTGITSYCQTEVWSSFGKSIFPLGDPIESSTSSISREINRKVKTGQSYTEDYDYTVIIKRNSDDQSKKYLNIKRILPSRPL